MYEVTWNFLNFSRNLEWTLCWSTSWQEFCRNFRRRQTLHNSGASPEGKFVCMTNTWRFCKRSLFLLLSRWPWENFNDRVDSTFMPRWSQRCFKDLQHLCQKICFFAIFALKMSNYQTSCNDHVFFSLNTGCFHFWLTRKNTKSRHWGRPRPHRCDQRMDALGWKLRYQGGSLIYLYIYIPGTQMILLLLQKGLVLRGWLFKNRGHLGSRYIYTCISLWMIDGYVDM